MNVDDKARIEKCPSCGGRIGIMQNDWAHKWRCSNPDCMEFRGWKDYATLPDIERRSKIISNSEAQR